MRVLVVDDHQVVMDGLRPYLRKIDPEVEIVWAPSAEDALDRLDSPGEFDLVLLDVVMPGMNGLDGLTEIRDRRPEIPVVMISGQADRNQILTALYRGAAGFIEKHLPGAAMVKAVELVLAGETYIPSRILAAEGLQEPEIDEREQAAPQSKGPLGALSRREREVLSLLLKGHSNKEIAKDLGVKNSTAAFHLRGVLKKLGAANRGQAVARAMALGWRPVKTA